MRVFNAVCLCIVLLSFGAAAEAAVDPSVLQTNGDGCAGDMTTDGCFGDPNATGFNGPEVTKCVARAYKNQACRVCKPAVLPNGQEGGPVCGYTTTNSSCDCKFDSKGCYGAGVCEYTP